MGTTGARLQSLLGGVRRSRALGGRRDPEPFNWRNTIRARLMVCAAVLGLWTAGIEARLVYLQVFDHANLLDRGARQQTRTFQALRIWVNRELDEQDAFLVAAARRLLSNARLADITFHSLEDRIVKHTFRAMEKAGEGLRILTKRPLVPADEEVARNPRARSAKLRAIERFA